MEALRSHPFFEGIRWGTLWDDVPPPLESGLVRRESAPADEWDDVGAAWDELVSGPDGSDDEDEDDESVEGSHPHGNPHTHARSRAPGDDGIEWAPDAQVFVSPPAIPPEEIGPHGEMPDYARASLSLGEVVDAVGAVVPGSDIDGIPGEPAVGDGVEVAVSGGYGMLFTSPIIDGVSKTTITAPSEVVSPALGPIPSPAPSPSPSPRKGRGLERGSLVGTSTETGDGLEGWQRPRACPCTCREGCEIRMRRAHRMAAPSRSSAPPLRQWESIVADCAHEAQRPRAARRREAIARGRQWR